MRQQFSIHFTFPSAAILLTDHRPAPWCYRSSQTTRSLLAKGWKPALSARGRCGGALCLSGSLAWHNAYTQAHMPWAMFYFALPASLNFNFFQNFPLLQEMSEDCGLGTAGLHRLRVGLAIQVLTFPYVFLICSIFVFLLQKLFDWVWCFCGALDP